MTPEEKKLIYNLFESFYLILQHTESNTFPRTLTVINDELKALKKWCDKEPNE